MTVPICSAVFSCEYVSLISETASIPFVHFQDMHLQLAMPGLIFVNKMFLHIVNSGIYTRS